MGGEYVAMEDMDMGGAFLLEKTVWLWETSSCWRRLYGHGRCFLVGEEHMGMEDILFSFISFVRSYVILSCVILD